MPEIKCGLAIMEIQDGDYVLDNGFCLQFIKKRGDIYRCSKKAFSEFKKIEKVKRQDYEGPFGDMCLDSWVYLPN